MNGTLRDCKGSRELYNECEAKIVDEDIGPAISLVSNCFMEDANKLPEM